MEKQIPDIKLTAERSLVPPLLKLHAENEDLSPVLQQMTLSNLVCALALFEQTAKGFAEIASSIEDEIKHRDSSEIVSSFGQSDPLVAVTDSQTGESYGGISFENQTVVARSTSRKKNRDEVVKALQEAGLESAYTKTTTELQNGALFTAWKNGSLPDSVANLLTETSTTKLVVSHNPAIAPAPTPEN